MKRYPVVIGATAAGLAGVLSFHSTNAHPLTNSVKVAKGTAKGPTTTTPPSTTSPTTQPTSSPGSTKVSAPTTTAPSAGPSTATGTPEQYGYGVLSVRVTVSGAKITDLAVAKLQTADTYSQQIADQVIPYLRREVLSLQSARINGISGATYTSEAYALSVQSALDRLHHK